MGASAGRLVLISLGGNRIAACKSKSIKIAKEPIDITSDDDGAWRTLLDGAVGSRTVEISVEGVYKSTAASLVNAEDLQTQALADGDLVDVEVIVPGNANSLSGQFMVTGFDASMPTDDATSFSCTLTSSGPVVETPAST